MQTKTILTIAIIAALPFGAMADWTEGGITYHSVSAPLEERNTAVVSANEAPYQTATIGEYDDEHIATTAYVKGAYNDTIAAINTINNGLASKQSMLYTTAGIEVSSDILDKDAFIDAYENGIADDNSDTGKSVLVSAQGVAKLVDVQRVKIYTTWDDDRASATTEVPLVVASGQ